MIIYLGIPIVFGLFFLWAGVQAVRNELEPATLPGPDKYRS